MPYRCLAVRGGQIGARSHCAATSQSDDHHHDRASTDGHNRRRVMAKLVNMTSGETPVEALALLQLSNTVVDPDATSLGEHLYPQSSSGTKSRNFESRHVAIPG